MVGSIVRQDAARCLFALVAACGRVGFDPGSDSAPAGPDAATDGGLPPTCSSGDWIEAMAQPFDRITSHPPNEQTEWAAQISSDGLRLVYATSGGPGPDAVYLTQRPTVADPFEPRTLVQLDNVPYSEDPSLSNDQLELYFVTDSATRCIYVARRADTHTQVWGPPKQLLGCDARGLPLDGPYLTDDGARLYYHETVGGVTTMMMTSRGSTALDFDQPGAPVRWDAPGGQPAFSYCALSGDEHTIYCEHGDPPQLWQATRVSIDAPFTSVAPVPGIMTAISGDPSVTGDGTLLVYASASSRQPSSPEHLHLAQRSCP